MQNPTNSSRAGTIVRASLSALALAGLVACARPASAATTAPAAVDPNAFVREAIFDGPTDVLWHLLTTEEGVESWLAPHAQVDLRVGGFVKTNGEADGKIGDPMTVVNRVLALTPGRSVAVRVDQTPQNYPLAAMVVGTWYEVSVDPVASGKSRLRCVGHGFPTGYTAYVVRPMFEKAADLVFEHLRAAVGRATPPEPAKATAARAPAKEPERAPPKRTR